MNTPDLKQPKMLFALIACGIIGGTGWYLIHRSGKPLTAIKTAVTEPNTPMPLGTTLAHALLQIITVGLGSPLGREVAPREAAAALTGSLARKLKIEDGQLRLLTACAAGAGLAAVYNVPLAAAVFVLETLVFSWQWQTIAAALISSGLAAAAVRIGLGDLVQYPLPPMQPDTAMHIWAALIGILLGIAAKIFAASLKHRPQPPYLQQRFILRFTAYFALIGLLAIPFPAILGNGKAGDQLSFIAAIGGTEALALLAAKWLAVWLAMAAGAYGGKITPSMMIGSMIGLCSALAWNLFLPAVPLGLAAVISAAVFLGLVQNMPITALIFLLELTRLSPACLLPMVLAMGSGLLARRLYPEIKRKNAP